MVRSLLCLFGIIFISFVFWFCNFSEAQASPIQAGAEDSINDKSPTNQKSKQSQKRAKHSGQRNRRQRIPKAERNRLYEGKSKKSIYVRKRKKSHKPNGRKICKTKRNANTLPSEDIERAENKKKNGQKGLNITTERVDDIPLLIAAMVKMGIQEAIDRYILVHKNQRDLSWGWTAIIWLAYILSEGDHRKVAVQEYVGGMQNTLKELTGMAISERDFFDDRLTNLARYLSKDKFWNKIEKRISENSIEAYALPEETVRVDATTVSGYHEPAEYGIFQYGHSKDDPNRPQIKIMTGSLDPLGMPLATDVVSGERADDGLYTPIISRISSMLRKDGVLYVGDCKLSSIDNRLHIKGIENSHYLCPLPNTGKTPKKMEKWIDEGNTKDKEDELIKYIVKNDKGKAVLKAKGYEIEREQSGKIDGKEIKWEERVLIVKSPAYEKQKKKGLERRLENAVAALYKLTPPRGPGKRQIIDEAKLIESAKSVLKKHRVKDLLVYEFVREVERKIKYIGRGRGGANRKKEITERIRYQITSVRRNEENIEEAIKKYGWKVYVTDVSKERLGFIDVVKSYRKQYRVERIFSQLKSRLNIAPLYVKRKDQIKGITHVLMLGVRVYTLIEFVVRRSLDRSDEKLVGLYLGNPKKATNIPTCERILKSFSKVTLTIIEAGNSVIRHLPPLSLLQSEILCHLGFNSSVYENLENKQYANLKLE